MGKPEPKTSLKVYRRYVCVCVCVCVCVYVCVFVFVGDIKTDRKGGV